MPTFMNYQKTSAGLRCLYALILVSLCFYGCEKDKGELGNPAIASFTVSPVDGKVNTFRLESTSDNAFRYQWDLGDGQGLLPGDAVHEAYYLKKGSYEVKLYAYGRGGYDVAAAQVTVENDDLSPILESREFQLLTAHSWKLDPASNAPIIVGTEGNPGEYFGGGSLADCQIDDTYTFAFIDSDFKVSYNANGATFNAGNVEPNYSCGSDRSYNMVSFSYSTQVSGAGLATITLPSTPPAMFIGVTDVSSNNYRIISISENELVLRSGRPNETVHQFRFVPAQ